MSLLQPIWMQHTGADPAVDYSALELRNILSGLVRSEGVLQNGLLVSQRGAGANFSVDVAAGYAMVAGDDVAAQGLYLIRSDAVANVVTPVAPGSGTRVHRLVAQIRDKFHNGAYTTYEWTLDLLQDTGAGTPAVPNSALDLATISITAGQANVSDPNITSRRATAALVTGQLAQVASDAGRPAQPFVSETIWRTDKKCFETWSGTAWREYHVAAEGPAYGTYTPVWTSAGTAPVLGNGTVTGRYEQVGKKVTFLAEITSGTTTTYGTGAYSISLPVAARTGAPSQFVDCRLFDGGVGYDGQTGALGSTSASLQAHAAGSNQLSAVTNVAPATWSGAGNVFRIWGTYEAA